MNELMNKSINIYINRNANHITAEKLVVAVSEGGRSLCTLLTRRNTISEAHLKFLLDSLPKIRLLFVYVVTLSNIFRPIWV